MPLNGTNKFCEQCMKECKQWRQVVVVRCPNFASTQPQHAKSKKAVTLREARSAQDAFLDGGIPEGGAE